ncbi:MAG TPA: class I SAM-dependent methyltransferase [Geminicoccaceae bacterium]|jgi:predicted TPR repeat methyltransferase|nr:class I SAM-dependent methyltransferase [Geminicoccaceae bacterium]
MSEASRERRLEQVYGARSNAELRAIYDDWAGRYDEDLRAFGYSYPPPIAGLVARYVKERDAPILDAGAGTGLVGEVLSILGYTELTGIDLSDGMLAVARAKGVYAELRNQVLGERLDFPDDRFAAVVSAGVLTTGHAPPSCFDELIRITRAGGHLIFTLAMPVYEEGGFRPKLEALAAERRWRPVETTPAWRALPRAPSEASLMARAFVFEVL